jgi:hypothetical protein
MAKAKSTKKRARRTKPYPSIPFEDALTLGRAIMKYGGGLPIKRLTLMEKLERSPTSGATRAMITDSGKYGITEGSFNAETIKLTPDGKMACAGAGSQREVLRASFKLAIEGIIPFKAMFDHYVNNRLPSKEVVKDFLEDSSDLGVYGEDVHECIDLFVVNCKSIGVLRPIAGAETLVPIENVLDALPTDEHRLLEIKSPTLSSGGNGAPDKSASSDDTDWKHACLYISPIGDEGSIERQHSDLFLGSLVRPAAEELGLIVRRADEIDHAGMITGVVMQWLDKAKLVVADLSYLNPNVFYEMALRHAKRKPLVCVIQKKDRIPFDVNQLGIVVIDNHDLFSFVPQIDSYRSQIAAKARRAIEDPDSVGNPLLSFYPRFWDDIAMHQHA